MLVFAENNYMINKPPLQITNEIVSKIRQEIILQTDKKNRGISLAELADRCECDPVFLGFIRKGERGPGIKLDYAIRIWTGLGHPPETLIADCAVEPLLAARIKRIQAGDYARTLELFAEVFSNWEHASPTELAKVEAYLEMIRDRIIESKDRQEAEPGGKLSNSGEGK